MCAKSSIVVVLRVNGRSADDFSRERSLNSSRGKLFSYQCVCLRWWCYVIWQIEWKYDIYNVKLLRMGKNKWKLESCSRDKSRERLRVSGVSNNREDATCWESVKNQLHIFKKLVTHKTSETFIYSSKLHVLNSNVVRIALCVWLKLKSVNVHWWFRTRCCHTDLETDFQIETRYVDRNTHMSES